MQIKPSQIPSASVLAKTQLPSCPTPRKMRMNPRTVPSRPSSGEICAMVPNMFSRFSSRATSTRLLSSSNSRSCSRDNSRLRMAIFVIRATGPGVASQIATNSTML